MCFAQKKQSIASANHSDKSSGCFNHGDSFTCIHALGRWPPLAKMLTIGLSSQAWTHVAQLLHSNSCFTMPLGPKLLHDITLLFRIDFPENTKGGGKTYFSPRKVHIVPQIPPSKRPNPEEIVSRRGHLKWCYAPHQEGTEICTPLWRSPDFPNYVRTVYIAELVSNYLLSYVISCVLAKLTMWASDYIT